MVSNYSDCSHRDNGDCFMGIIPMSNHLTLDDILESAILSFASNEEVESFRREDDEDFIESKQQLSQLIAEKERIAYNRGIVWTAEDNITRRKLMEPKEVAKLIGIIIGEDDTYGSLDSFDPQYIWHETRDELKAEQRQRAKEAGFDV